MVKKGNLWITRESKYMCVSDKVRLMNITIEIVCASKLVKPIYIDSDPCNLHVLMRDTSGCARKDGQIISFEHIDE